MVREVQIEVAALRLPTRKLFTDAVDETLPDELARNLKNATGELWSIGLGKCASHFSQSSVEKVFSGPAEE
jgi:hypothetical protein